MSDEFRGHIAEVAAECQRVGMILSLHAERLQRNQDRVRVVIACIGVLALVVVLVPEIESRLGEQAITIASVLASIALIISTALPIFSNGGNPALEKEYASYLQGYDLKLRTSLADGSSQPKLAAQLEIAEENLKRAKSEFANTIQNFRASALSGREDSSNI